ISSAVLVELIDEVERAIDAAAQTAKAQNDRALDITNADARRATFSSRVRDRGPTPKQWREDYRTEWTRQSGEDD
ncbi:MAG: hypothetical protein WBG18_19715, partial [Xanthobacteraceae bacterium]